MKTISIAASAFLIAILLQSCLKDKLTHTYTIYTPVYKSKSEVYANIKSNPPQEIKSPGKFFLYQNYIFLNEVNEGVHVIDNTDPQKPVEKAFINIPGNIDIAVKGNTLYADLYTDLVAIDIYDPLNATFIKYIPNIFPERIYSDGFIADSSRIIVDWTRKDTTVDYLPPGGMIYYSNFLAPSTPSNSGGSPAPGIAGSTARFAIVNNYLYTVNTYSLSTFDISIANDPQKISSNNIGWTIETIYPFKDKLFIGSNSGVFIYDISNPSSPASMGQFTHARSCDPVIVDGNTAYITLHDGTVCGGYSNELDILNVTNLSSPSLIKTYLMTNPHGLTKDNDQLFICDGTGGLRSYNVGDPSNIVLKETIPGLVTVDAVAWNKNLVVLAQDGLYQFDYSNPDKLVQRSKLTVIPSN